MAQLAGASREVMLKIATKAVILRVVSRFAVPIAAHNAARLKNARRVFFDGRLMARTYYINLALNR